MAIATEDLSMATFCGQCGFPQSTSSTFCPNCGGRLPAAASSPVPMKTVYVPVPAPPPAAKPKGSSALKIVLILLVFFAVGAAAVIGGVYYVAHKVKQTVVEKAATYGVDLSSSPSSGDSSAALRPLPKACDLLSAPEVAQFLGEPIERKEQQSDGACYYYGPAGLSAQLAQQQAASTFHRAEAPGSNVSANEITNSVDQLASNLAASGARTGTGGEMPLLMLIVGTDGKTQMNALNAAGAIFGGIASGANAKGLTMSTKIPGLGDQAVRMPKLGLNVLQGDNFVRIIAGPVPDADAKTIEIARAVLPKI